MEVTDEAANRQIARAAGIVMVAFVISNLAGLARQILVTDAFGTKASFDSFSAANRVSETLFYLVAGGALSSAFIPTFTSLLARGERKAAWKLTSAIFNLVLIVLIAAAALAAIFAPQVVRYAIAPGFADDPEQFTLTVNLLRLMLPSAALFGISGLVMAILNSHQVFLIPSLTPAMYQIGMILGVVLFAPSLGIYGLAWGVLLGAALHLLLQLPSLWRLRGEYTPTLGLRMPVVREVASLMGPRMFGVAVVQLNFWINISLASHMAEGSAGAITLALALMLMPQAAIAQSIAIAAMPTLSTQFALGKLDEMRSSLSSSLRWALLLAVPATFGLIMLRIPVVQALYQRGQFDEHSTQLVTWALLWYTAGLVGHTLVEITSRAFFALHDTRTPVIVGSLAMGVNIVLSIVLSDAFARAGWMPHGGLALANSLATAGEAAALLYLIRRRLKGLEGRRVWAGVGQALLSALGMAGALIWWLQVSASLAPWLIAAVGILLGAAVFVLLAWIAGMRELKEALVMIKQRFAR